MREKLGIQEYNAEKLIIELGSLYNEVGNILVRLQRVPAIPLEDSRYIAMGGIQSLIAPIIFQLQAVRFAIFSGKGPDLAGNFGMPIQKLLFFVDKSFRLSLLISTHFITENLFSNILQAIDNTSKLRGFDAIARDLFSKLNLPGTEDKIATLKAFSSFRNAYHNNGVHRNANFAVTIDGVEFDFKKDQIVEKGVGVFDLIKLLKAVFRILDDVIFSETVGDLPMPIADTLNSSYMLPTDQDFESKPVVTPKH